MIRIDDLVRQRLSGGDEPERPGAWLNMRELLDKEMPVADGYNWRRLIGYLCLLLLLGTATVGGYQWYRSGLGAAGGGSSLGSLNNPSGTPAGNADFATSRKANAASSPAGMPAENVDAAAPQSATTTPAATASQHMPGAMAAQRSTLPSDIAAASKSAAKPQAPRPDPTTQQYATALTLNEGTRNSNANTTSEASALKRSHRNAAPAAKLSPAAFSASSEAAAVRMRSLQAVPATALSVAPIQQPTLARIKHDSIQRLEIITRRVYDAFSERYVYRIDTVPRGKFARTILLPLPADEQLASASAPKDAKPRSHSKKHEKAASDMDRIAANKDKPGGIAASKDALAKADDPVPNAAPGNVAPADNNSDAAKLNEAASKRFHLFDLTKLAAAIDKAKSDLARIEMYPGLMGGINASLFTPNALGGIQAGITSLFILNDWWSLMAELKYYQRFNTGSSVRDDYKQVKNASITFQQYNGQDYKVYDWWEGTIRHGFNYDVVRTFELPVMLRRNWGQAYAQCGLNFVLSSTIAVRETTDSLNDLEHHTEWRPATHDNTAFIPNDHPLVLTSDFGARFGVGYVISGGYMFTPNIYVDGRITQSFWDNSKTDGAKQVARDLLRTPSIQLSVGYRFGPK